jgi:hypothetical protein
LPRRWKVRPEHSNWGDFGDDDQVGRLNLITPERRRTAAAEVREGLAFCLSLPLDLPGGNLLVPQRFPPVRSIADMPKGHTFVNYPLAAENEHWIDHASDDAVLLYTQYSTQWDALSHAARHFDADQDGEAELVYYNGYRANVDVVGPRDPSGPGARRLGIEKTAETCVQGRGVMIDLFSEFGALRRWVNYDDLMRIMDENKITVETGDMLCLHTGWAHGVLERNGAPDHELLHEAYAVLDGNDSRLLDWIERTGVAVIIADNFAVEGFQQQAPDKKADHFAALPIHQRCLVDLGIHLGELWYLTDLSAWLKSHQRSRFFLTAPPLRLPGSFGSPLTPVGTV